MACVGRLSILGLASINRTWAPIGGMAPCTDLQGSESARNVTQREAGNDSLPRYEPRPRHRPPQGVRD